MNAELALPRRKGFNTQPPKGGCPEYKFDRAYRAVSTHSRLKAAGLWLVKHGLKYLFQHTAA